MWEVSWRRRQTATYWPKVLLATIAALLPHLGWAAQPWVAEGPSPLSGAGSHSYLQLRLELNWNWLTQVVCGTWLYNCLTPTCFLWTYASAPSSTTSTGQGDIPISSTRCTCFTVVLLIYTGVSLDWQLGRGSICYIIWVKFFECWKEKSSKIHSTLFLFFVFCFGDFCCSFYFFEYPEVCWLILVVQ